MSGSASKKYKKYMMEQPDERRRYFGNITPKNENGIMDLTPYCAANNNIIISHVHYDLSRIEVKKKKRKQS